MDTLMVIVDRLTHPTRGLVVSGVNPVLDAIGDDEIRGRIGGEVTIKHRDGRETVAKVEAVDIARSILGKANIHIALGWGVTKEEVELGAEVLCKHNP